MAKAFEARFPGIAVRVERTGAERIFQRIGQEYASRIHAVDVVNSSDASHFIVWKRDGMLAPFVPEDVAKHYAPEQKDPDGQFASFRAALASSPTTPSWSDRPTRRRASPTCSIRKWDGKIVKAHPGYSGTIMTATYEMARDLGWDYFEKLAKQQVMQVQSAADPPKKVALGERAVMADGNDYSVDPGQGTRPAGRDRLPGRRHAADGRAERGLQGGAQSQCGAAVPVLLLHRPNASSW